MQDKQAVLFMSHFVDDTIIERFNSIGTDDSFEKWLLLDTTNLHASSEYPPSEPKRTVRFSVEQIKTAGYQAINPAKVVPGSNHFAVLEFAALHPEYSHIWVVEYDVVYSGCWNEFLSCFPFDIDFLTTDIRTINDDPTWCWWRSFRSGQCERKMSARQMVASFNPIYRLTRAAALHLRSAFLSGCKGHHEVTMPTILTRDGFSIEELGGNGRYTPKSRIGRFYNRDTFHWRPTIDASATKKHKDTLYHPVKLPPAST